MPVVVPRNITLFVINALGPGVGVAPFIYFQF